MKAIQNTSGGVIFSAREYDIAKDTKITVGQVVCLEKGLVVAAEQTPTGEILGIAAETHNGTKDALNSRADGEKITVYDSPTIICASRAPEGKATSGTESTVTIGELGALSADELTGGYLKLIQRGEGSTNTDAIGTEKRIEGFSISSGEGTFTVSEGATACEGDVYLIFPPAGFDKATLDKNGTAFTLGTVAENSLRIIGRKGDNVLSIAKKHILK